jgi:hypothetical protein
VRCEYIINRAEILLRRENAKKSSEMGLIRPAREFLKELEQNEYVKTKDGALQLIIYLAYNYNECNTADNLKGLIDEIVNIAKIGLTKQ